MQSAGAHRPAFLEIEDWNSRRIHRRLRPFLEMHPRLLDGALAVHREKLM